MFFIEPFSNVNDQILPGRYIFVNGKSICLEFQRRKGRKRLWLISSQRPGWEDLIIRLPACSLQIVGLLSVQNVARFSLWGQSGDTTFHVYFLAKYPSMWCTASKDVYDIYTVNKYRVLSSCHGDPLTIQREFTWVDQFSGDPLGVTHLVKLVP